MSIVIAQINIDDSSDKTITGVYTFDRDCGGTLIAPNGAAFPASPVACEVFWHTDLNTIYRRNDSNTTWVPIPAQLVIPGATFGSTIYYDGYAWVDLPAGTDGYFLQTHGVGNAPTWENHDALRKLIHLSDNNGPFEGFASGAYKETLPTSSPFPTSIIWWESSAKLEKIVEKTITYNANKTPNAINWKAYHTDGTTVLANITDAIVYSGVFETSRTRTIL